MSNMMKFAESELDIIGLVDDGDEMNGAMRKHILHMIHEFSKEGHSGFSANYAVNLLSKLLKYEPLTPLTGDDSEWMEISKEMTICNTGTLYQNKRLSRVFKDDNGAYDSEGKIFWEWYSSPDIDDGKPYKTYFSCRGSRVPVTFPYTPTQVYEEHVGEE